MMIIGGIVLYGPIEFWIYLSGSALAFVLLNFVSILHDKDYPLPKMDEGITWLSITTSWISAAALAVIAIPLLYIALRDHAREMWQEIKQYSFFQK